MAYLEMIDIVKRYPGVVANDHVDLALARGEIHAVMGENGAGKSTLMSILYGLQSPDEGYIRFRGSTLLLRSPPMPSRKASGWCIKPLSCSSR